MASLRTLAFAPFLGLVFACTGEIGSPSGSTPRSPSPGSASTVPGSMSPAPAAPGPGSTAAPTPVAGSSLPYAPPAAFPPALPARVWLLTPEEYGRAVEALLGVPLDVSGLDPIPDTGIYPNMSASGVVRVALADQYSELSRAVVERIPEPQLVTLVGCEPLAATCKDAFLSKFIGAAFRRPATADDLARYGEIFAIGAATTDPSLPFRAVLRGLLTSPFFLYRTEIGPAESQASATFRLTGHEVATFLSFSVLGRPPAEALLAAAARGDLTDATKLGGVVTELLAQPESQQRFGEFLLQWLKLHQFERDVEKFEDVFPGFNGVKSLMFEEARSFLASQGGMDDTLNGLLTGTVPTGPAALATFYASDASASGGRPRVGLLSLGALLSKTAKQYLTSPTLRGLFVRDQLLCQHIALPDNFTPPPIEMTEASSAPKTTRQLYELHAKEPACASCHSLLDSIGFTLEVFDGAGRFRTTETYDSPSFNAPSLGPQPIDASGRLVGTDVDGPYSSYVELAAALSGSSWVKECVARQAFRYYFGEPESDRGIPPVAEGARALIDSGKLGSLVTSLLSTQSTFERKR